MVIMKKEHIEWYMQRAETRRQNKIKKRLAHKEKYEKTYYFIKEKNEV